MKKRGNKVQLTSRRVPVLPCQELSVPSGALIVTQPGHQTGSTWRGAGQRRMLGAPALLPQVFGRGVAGRGGHTERPLAGGGRGVAEGVAGQEFPTMPRCSAAADGCCAVALPFAASAARSAPRGPGSRAAPAAAAAPQRLQPPAGPALPLPPPPPPRCRPRCPSAMNPPGGEESGAAGGGCRGAEGGGDSAGAAGVPEEPGLAVPDESLEEKLRSLTFRKQVSYRWVLGGERLPALAVLRPGQRREGSALEPQGLFFFSSSRSLKELSWLGIPFSQRASCSQPAAAVRVRALLQRQGRRGTRVNEVQEFLPGSWLPGELGWPFSVETQPPVIPAPPNAR